MPVSSQEPILSPEDDHSPLRLWLRRLPYIAFLRLMVPAIRVIRGAPLRHYSRVLPGLWVGGQHFLRGVASMQRQGISAVVNLRTWPDDRERGREFEHYLWLPTTDHTPPTFEDIQRGVDFINGHIEAGREVYVHCRAGVGRGPTMTACYLVHSGMTPNEAWATIRKVRPFIFPTTTQIVQVRQYYENLQRQNMIDDA